MKPNEGEFVTRRVCRPGESVTIPASYDKPVYVNVGGNDVLSMVLLKPEDGWNVPALLVDPANPVEFFEGIRDTVKTIGRGIGRIALRETASRKHFTVRLDSRDGIPTFVIQDQYSTNGTYIVEPVADEIKTSKTSTSVRNDTLVSIPSINHERARKPIEIGFSSKPSDNHPSWNEDSLVANASDGVFAVFDGVGGHQGGTDASKYASQEICKEINRRLAKLAGQITRYEYSSILKQSLGSIDAKLFEKGYGSSYLTTATVMLQTPWGELVIASVGDSRAYMHRSGQLKSLTKDNAYGAIFEGPLTGDETYPQRVLAEMDFTSDSTDKNIQRAFHHRNQIINCLGIGMSEGTPAISVTYFKPQAGDIVLLSTDGIHDNLKDSEIAEHVKSNRNALGKVIADKLVASAYKRSKEGRLGSHRPKPDDMTVVAVKF